MTTLRHVTWVLRVVRSTNHYSEHVIDETEVPRQLIKSAAGDFLLQQTQPKVTLTHTSYCLLADNEITKR